MILVFLYFGGRGTRYNQVNDRCTIISYWTLYTYFYFQQNAIKQLIARISGEKHKVRTVR